MEDKWLIREIQNGRKEYLQDIAAKYYDDIYRFCCYQTGNTEDSYDLAQETFLRFIRYVENYRCRNLKGYLLTIAMNVCRDYYARCSRTAEYEKPGQAQGMDGHQQASMQTGPEETAVKDEDARRLLQKLGELPHIQREAIVLHYYYDMKFKEIARLTGVSTATAKSRVKQGMEKLRKRLGKEEFYENG